jgi:flagellar biosynthesis protein FlhG
LSLNLSRIKLWSIGGGKGGIGKSVVSLGLGISLARLGKKVILIDADLGGANLHTLMGVRYPHVTLEHFMLKKVDRLEDTIIQTEMDGIGLICGADDILGSANPTYSQKIRLLNQIEALPAQYVILDLGAGTAFNILDFFNYSPGRIVLFTSQTTSLQNAYGFIKSALYRKISRDFAKDEEVMNLLYQDEGQEVQSTVGTISDLLAHLRERAPESYERLTNLLKDFQLFLIANMVKTNTDLKSPEIIQSVCTDFLSLQPEIMGHVNHDPAIESAVDHMTQFPLSHKKSKAGSNLAQIALKVVKESMLPRSINRGQAEIIEEEEAAVDPLVTQPSYSSVK